MKLDKSGIYENDSRVGEQVPFETMLVFWNLIQHLNEFEWFRLRRNDVLTLLLVFYVF